MATEFKLPELGENIVSGNVTSVMVSPGDTISVDQPVLELETEKAVIEVPSSVSGTISAVRVQAGDTISVGQVILTVDGTGPGTAEAGATVPEQVQLEPTESLERAPYGLPEWKQELRREEEQRNLVPPVVVRPEDVQTPAAAPPTAPPAAAAPEIARELAPASPSVRRLAREIGIDINLVKGSGPGGRISEEDVKGFARQRAAQPPLAARAAGPLPDFSRWGPVERQPMSSVRRTTAEHLSTAWATIPHVTQFDRADATELEKLRRRYAAKVEAAGGKLTVTAIVLKVVAAALKVFPQFNASVDMASSEIILKHYYHIGVAVDTDRGLLVPVIRDVDQKSIVELSVELMQASERARNRKTSLEELYGGTFTVTNLGGIGGTNFAPIVNAPEVAILGVARASVEPVFVDGQFEPRMMLPLSLSYDHRVIDGADGARFLRWVAEALQEPFLLLLEG